MRLQRLAHEAVEPNHAGRKVVRARWVEPRQNAAPALGRDAHRSAGGKPELLHQRGIEPDRKPRRVGKLVGKMIDAGMHVSHAPVEAMRVMMVGTVVHDISVPTETHVSRMPPSPGACRLHS